MTGKHKHWTALITPLRFLAMWAILLGGVAPVLVTAGPSGPVDRAIETTAIPEGIASQFISQAAKLLAADGVASDYFGISVSVSGDTLVVGAYGDDSGRGSAYVFYRNQGGKNAWGQVARLTADDGAAGDNFGQDVAISGDTIVIGANGDDSARGSAYVFYRNQGGADVWGQVARLTAADGAANDVFGHSVTVSGDTVVVGAPQDDTKRGAAYVFYRNQGGPNAWGQVRKLTAADGAANNLFGYVVAISGDTVVAGACYNDNKGAAYIFYRNQGGVDAWGQVRKLTAADGAAGDLFGWFLAIGGDTIVVGAPHDGDLGDDSGSAYVFDRNQGGVDAWGQVKKLTAVDGAAYDSFGCGMSVDGDTIVVGASWDDDNGSGSGSAYVFNCDEGGVNAWGQVDKLTADDGAAGDMFGYTVSVDDHTIVVGAYWDDAPDTDSGSAYVLELPGDMYLPVVFRDTK